jgi:hypothetical protein
VFFVDRLVGCGMWDVGCDDPFFEDFLNGKMMIHQWILWIFMVPDFQTKP